MLDVTDQINDPKQNVIDQSFSGSTGLIMAYAQSFLREELGKMYRGELVLRGIPEIEPMDVLLITDPSTGMTRYRRPAETKQVRACGQRAADHLSDPVPDYRLAV